MQIAEPAGGRRRIIAHVGSAHTKAELGLLVERARALLQDPGQGEFDLGIEPVAAKTPLLAPAGGDTLFGDPVTTTRERVTAAAPRVISTASRVLYDVLAGVFTSLGFDALGDDVFGDLVIARIVEPTSILDTRRVLTDLGCKPASEKTMRRALARCGKDGYRDQLAALCFARARAGSDVSLCLYDVTTLLCRRRHKSVYADLLVMPMPGVLSQVRAARLLWKSAYSDGSILQVLIYLEVVLCDLFTLVRRGVRLRTRWWLICVSG